MEKLYTKERRQARRRFYKSKLWKSMSKYQKLKEPFCVECKSEGKIVRAQAADHIIPWQTMKEAKENKLQSLCHFHHNVKTHFEDLPAMRKEQKCRMEFWDG